MGRSVVLVIDDDEDIAASIADVLRTSGYHATIAADGKTAVTLAGVEPVGLVLLDWRLPEAPAGRELVAALRLAGGRDLPVVALSADPFAVGEAEAAHVSEFLSKPFDVADLLVVVDRLCGVRDARN